MESPDVSYTRSGDVAVAYQVFGDGPTDLVFLPFQFNLWWLWRYPQFPPFMKRLAKSCRIVLVNTRGAGLADRPRGVTVEARMEDVLAVLDSLEIRRCTVLGIAESAATAALLAASYPERVERLILHAPVARGTRADDFPWAPSREEWIERLAVERSRWGEREFLEELARALNDGVPAAEAIESFLEGEAPPEVPDSVLATVLFTDLTGSTERAAALGDRAWRELLARHHSLVRRELARYRGEERDTAGDGFFATFDGPARAIRCARVVVEGVRELGLDLRAGVHTGECELHEDKVAGIAVSIGARIGAAAAPGQVLVSQTVKDLVAGSGIEFEDRAEHELNGVPGTWRLYAAR